jgi:hypothetical protein
MKTPDQAQPDDDVWDALARGDLSDEEHALLKALGENDPEIQARLDAFTPAGAAFEQRVSARLSSDTRRRTRNRARALVGVGSALAMAAAILLWIGRPTGDEGALEGWEVTISAGARQTRSTPAEGTPRFGPETALTIVMAPPERTDAELEVAAFLVQGERVRRWDPPIERAPSGAMRIEGRTRELLPGVPTGRWTIAIIVGVDLPAETVLRAWARERDPRAHPMDIELEAAAP